MDIKNGGISGSKINRARPVISIILLMAFIIGGIFFIRYSDGLELRPASGAASALAHAAAPANSSKMGP
ncbi:MAG: hypothetical protein ABW184_15820 [Sphingobium sp.]